MERPSFRQRPESTASMLLFAMGLLGFVALQAFLVWRPAALRWPLGARGVFLLHLAVLGWITPVMLAADQQLMPVVLRRPLPGPRLGRVASGLYGVGVPVFLAGWLGRWPAGIAAGGAAAGAALLLFCGQAALAFRRGRGGGPVAWGLGGGIAFLALTAVLGPWMALAIGGALGAPGPLRAAHAAAGLVGWVLLTVMGATHQLVPYFAGTEPGVRPRFGTAAVALAGAGALWLVGAGLFPGVPAVPGVAGAAAGAAMWLYDLGRLARHGRQARREPVVAYSLCAAAAIAVGGAGAAAAWRAGRPHLLLAGAALGLLAGPSLLILGQLQKILPFLAALDAAAAGGGRVPKTEALFPRRRGFALLWALVAAFTAESAALALRAPSLLRLGAAAALAAGLAHALQQRGSLAAWAGARRRSGAEPGGPLSPRG